MIGWYWWNPCFLWTTAAIRQGRWREWASSCHSSWASSLIRKVRPQESTKQHTSICEYMSANMLAELAFWCSKTLWFSGVSESKVNQTIPNMKHMDPPNLLSQHLSTRLITTVSWSIRTSHGNIRRTRFAARSHCSHRKQRSFCLENMTMWQ